MRRVRNDAVIRQLRGMAVGLRDDLRGGTRPRVGTPSARLTPLAGDHVGAVFADRTRDLEITDRLKKALAFAARVSVRQTAS